MPRLIQSNASKQYYNHEYKQTYTCWYIDIDITLNISIDIINMNKKIIIKNMKEKVNMIMEMKIE